MVKIEIVQDQDAVNGQSPYGSPASSRTSSSVSLSSVESEFAVEETLYERVIALKDIVPPSTRHAISTKISSASSFFRRSGKILGNVVWIVTTSALLVGLPLALSLEDEAKIVAQEKEMLAQQQGAQQVRPQSQKKNLSFADLYISCSFFLHFFADACWWRLLHVSSTFGPQSKSATQRHRSPRFLIHIIYHSLASYVLYSSLPTRYFIATPINTIRPTPSV
jgi:mitochondrial import receptor subunit TOM22